jgi:hypothetical protein
MQVIPTRTGEIYSHGPDTLAVEVIGHPKVAARVGRLLGTDPYQDGDAEVAYLFRPDRLPEVARLVRPYRRHRPSLKSLSNLIPGGPAQVA